jgi:hypothetical protein
VQQLSRGILLRRCAGPVAGQLQHLCQPEVGLSTGAQRVRERSQFNERRSGSTGLAWSIVDDSFIPDAAALRAAEEDVTRPWAAPARTKVARRFRAGGPRRWVTSMPTPLDGLLTAELRLPRGE